MFIELLFGPREFNLYGFLMGISEDGYGRYYDEFLQYSDRQLEQKHNYIQYMFPIDKKSSYEPAPIISEQDAYFWGKTETIICNIKRAYRRMRQFYSNNRHWITPNNHNYRRISRILRCLRLFGLDNEADDFFSFLEVIYEENESKIGPKVYKYWNDNNCSK